MRKEAGGDIPGVSIFQTVLLPGWCQERQDSSRSWVWVDTGQPFTILGLPQLSVCCWLRCTVLVKTDGGPGLANVCK